MVITNHNRCGDLRLALHSVAKQDYSNIEIIVVDNASTDDSRSMVKKEFPDVSVVELCENIGMDGYSVGFRQSHGEFIFQMDNDSLMPDCDVLSEVAQRFRKGPMRQAVVATRVEEYRYGKHEVDDLRKRDNRYGPINTGGFHAGGVGFRRVVLDSVGYYNRDVFLYASESFLIMKFLAAGHQIFYYPEILMLHKSSGEARSSRSLYFEIRNRYWFLRHFACPAQKVLFIPTMVLHDIFYTVSKGAFGSFGKALLDGLRKLPPSLGNPIRSFEPEYVKKIDEFGVQFGFPALWKRICRGIRNLKIR